MPINFENTETAFVYRSNNDLRQAHFLFSSMAKPWLTKLGIQMTHWAFALHLPVKGLIKKTIFKQFCGGETLEEADETAKMLAGHGLGVIMDYGVEGKSNEEEFEKTMQSFLKTIAFCKGKPHIPFISLKMTGFARFELLEKLHTKTPLNSAETEEVTKLHQRIDKICEAVAVAGKMILIDAEESWIQQPVDDLTNEMMEKYNRKTAIVFNTFQLYRHDRLSFLKQSADEAKSKGYVLGAKLVRGAYMEKERLRATEMSYEDPIQADKESTDRDFDAALRYSLEHIDHLHLFIGTHNEASCLLAADLMQQTGIPSNSDKVHFSQLYGMSDNISFNLAKNGYHVSKYLPYGPVEDVIPYLMRRAEENTSVAGQTGRELGLIKKELDRRKLSK